MCKFRDLRADEIECRVQSVKWDEKNPNKCGVVLLLYKDARVDMNILDETVGSANWQREHYECKGNLFCRVGIDVGTHEGKAERWVYKSDCGTESNTEAQKGEASDSFKRACFNWGIGRELYTAPFTWIPSNKCDISTSKNGSKQCYDKFVVEKINIKDKQIVGLVIRNISKNCIAFSFGDCAVKETPKAEPPKAEQKYICADCKVEVIPEMAKRTEKAFGVVLCKDCGLKRSMGK